MAPICGEVFGADFVHFFRLDIQGKGNLFGWTLFTTKMKELWILKDSTHHQC